MLDILLAGHMAQAKAAPSRDRSWGGRSGHEAMLRLAAATLAIAVLALVMSQV